MSDKKSAPKLWVSGDLNGFFGLCTNSITNTLVAVSLMQFVIGFPKEILFGKIVPGLVLSLAFGNIYFAWMAWRLAKKEGRAMLLPYLTVFLFPTTSCDVCHYAADQTRRRSGTGLERGCGLVLCPRPCCGHWRLRRPDHAKVTPVPLCWAPWQAWRSPILLWAPPSGLECGLAEYGVFGIIFVGWLANVEFPGKIPAGLVAVILGIIFGWVSGYMEIGTLARAHLECGHCDPRAANPRPFEQASPEIAPYLVTAIPLAIYLFLESLNNVESRWLAAILYDTREAMLAAAGGTLVAPLFGSPFPTLIYIGHPGWKSVGSRIGYSWMTGVTMLLLGVLDSWGFCRRSSRSWLFCQSWSTSAC